MKTNEEDNTLFTVDYNIMLQLGIPINQYFFLWLIHSGDVSKYRLYLEQFPSPVNRRDLDELIQADLLDLKNKTRESNLLFTFENLKTTDHYSNIFDRSPNNAIEELKSTYPKKTPQKGRRLQSDQHKWEPKYLAIIKNKPKLHDTIIKSIKAETAHRKKTGSQEFWALLTTYINNRRWEDYEDEIGEFSEEDKFSRDI